MEQKDWLEKHEVESYVGKNSNYYLKNWSEYRAQKVKGINISAFFFPAQWLGYRKMYAQAFLSYLFMFFVWLLSMGFYLLTEIVIYPFFSFLFARSLLGVFFAAYGNGIFRSKILTCTQYYIQFPNIDEYNAFLKRKGGTDFWLPILLGLIDVWLFYSCYESMLWAMNYTVTFLPSS